MSKRRKTKYPRSHVPPNTGLRLILFHYSTREKTVIIGPMKFDYTPSRPSRPNGWSIRDKDGLPIHPSARVMSRPIGKTIPEILNDGGTARVTIEYPGGQSYNVRTSVNPVRVANLKQYTVRYLPQPYSSDTLPKAAKFMKRVIKEISNRKASV